MKRKKTVTPNPLKKVPEEVIKANINPFSASSSIITVNINVGTKKLAGFF